MATQVFAEEELERLRGFPEIGRDELFRFFTLAPADVAFVDPGRGRGPADRLGLSVARCTLPWLGFVPDHVVAAPPVAVARLADQLGVDPGALRTYGRRAKTRTEHLRLVAQYRGWRLPTSLEFKEFDEFLLARALEHDSPTLLNPERQQRLALATEARLLGHGGVRAVAQAAGVSATTVRRGVGELDGTDDSLALGRSRRAGGGRKSVAELDPMMVTSLVEPDERGDPMSPLR